ncbi:hypothetical protein EV11_1183 [Prochlorococcus sp. SS52]|nr:hypothetical protein EV04_0544 [Prochlorococcus marinus str. LG]KGG19192.1 hypothetical protein EV08_1679 [Prochlorococcus marinus str. SS2]KGG25173.1 hypothetical protein EV09_0067 [Prochlorococcus marinus str. SS35]KGG32497.1 hypothetical protein EV10_1612 [Prochlorococcus marinus str. SS51]KGG35619.1 hypothetical protein EV11_1183 [Prochlorococcus sp. SS52]
MITTSRTQIQAKGVKKKPQPLKSEAEKLAQEYYKKMKVDWL